jgi:class 3 adenylate cyclase/YHS domain-containing protein
MSYLAWVTDGQPGSEPATAAESSAEQTFLFADLAGFTALTEAHGDDHAADLIGSFSAQVSEMLSEHGAEQVKTIGDALMIRVARAADGVRLALRIVEQVGGRQGFPAVRVGLHTGSAVARGDDWFGAAVNLSARVSRAAAASEVLLSDDTRLAASDGLEGIELVHRDRAQLRNVRRPVELWAAVPKGQRNAGDRLEIDPICRMGVIPERAAATVRRDGRTLYFCSPACAAAFGDYPESH